MNRRSVPPIAAAAALLIGLVGCAAQSAPPPSRPTPQPLLSGLVLPDDAGLAFAVADPAEAEFERHDAALARRDAPAYPHPSFVDVRQREYLRTSNGRPRESSVTIIRSTERRLMP